MIPRDVPLAALRRRLLVEDHRAEPDAAEEVALFLRAPRLRPALALRHVDAQELAGEAGRRRCGRGLFRLRNLDRGDRHTATGVSPGVRDGRPTTVSGRSRAVVFDAMNAVFTSNGWRFR